MKEIRVKPLGEANKEVKIMVYLFFFQPILCLIVATFMIYVNKELFRTNLVAQIIIGIFIFLAILGSNNLCIACFIFSVFLFTNASKNIKSYFVYA